MGGWISAACVPKVYSQFAMTMWLDYNASRTAYLVIIVAAFIFSIIVFMVNFINLVRFEWYEKTVKKWSIVVNIPYKYYNFSLLLSLKI